MAWAHPVAGSQVSVVQTLLSLQLIAAPAHIPAEQTSPDVQALLSSQRTMLGV